MNKLLSAIAVIAALSGLIGTAFAVDGLYAKKADLRVVSESVDYIRLESIQTQIRRLEAIPNRTPAEDDFLATLKATERRILSRLQKS